MPVVKPPALVEKPLDGQFQFQELGAGSPAGVFRVGQIVKNVSGTATALAGNETTGFFLVVEDNEAYLKSGGSNSAGLSWFLGGENRGSVRVIPVSGKKMVMTMVSPPANPVGNQYGLINSGDYTVVNGANTTNAAFKVEAVVERLMDGTVVVQGTLN
jgi:hypothetical protein